MILGPFKFDESRPYVSASPKECSTLPSTSDSDGKTVGATRAVKSSVGGAEAPSALYKEKVRMRYSTYWLLRKPCSALES